MVVSRGRHAIALLSRGIHPAPVASKVMGNLICVSRFLPETFHQLAQGPVRSLERYDVADAGGADPAGVTLAGEHLNRAAELAEQLGEELAKAQDALAGRGSKD